MNKQIELDIPRALGACPVINSSEAVILLTPGVTGLIAGAVQDADEWIAFLEGQRLDGGWVTMVTGLAVPEQTRSRANADIGVTNLPKNCVGIIHSHNNMKAYFSGTDSGVGGVNEFPCSVVVSTQAETDEEIAMGFAWHAETKVTLPCTRMGRVNSIVGVEGFPKVTPQEHVQINPEEIKGYKDAQDCPDGVTNNPQDANKKYIRATCGVKLKPLKEALWGRRDALLKAIEGNTKFKPPTHYSYQKGAKNYVRRDSHQRTLMDGSLPDYAGSKQNWYENYDYDYGAGLHSPDMPPDDDDLDIMDDAGDESDLTQVK